MRICIDAGHGMGNRSAGRYDPGAVNGEVTEAALTLAYALALRDELIDRSYNVVMTRATAEQPTPLLSRAKFSQGCDVFISLHCDSFTNNLANGNQCIFVENEASKNLAYEITKELSESMDLRPRRNIGNQESGGKAVLKNSKAAASVLVECGFLSNDGEREKLIADEAPQIIARAIADAIDTATKND